MLNKYLETKRAKGRNTACHVLLSKLMQSSQEDVPDWDNVRNILVWPKSSFGFFRKMLWKNLKELYGQPNISFFKKSVLVFCGIMLYFFLTFYFVLGYSQLTNNVMILSDELQRDSAIHIYGSTFPQTPLPCRLPRNTEQSSLCCTVGHFRLSMLNIAVST